MGYMWSDNERKILKDNINLSNAALIELLPGRSKSAIVQQKSKLFYSINTESTSITEINVDMNHNEIPSSVTEINVDINHNEALPSKRNITKGSNCFANAHALLKLVDENPQFRLGHLRHGILAKKDDALQEIINQEIARCDQLRDLFSKFLKNM